MTLFHYICIGKSLIKESPVFLLKEIENCDSSKDIIILISGFDGGKIIIGKNIFKIENGKCAIGKAAAELKNDGEIIAPKLMYEGKSYAMMPFSKEGESFKKASPPEAYIEKIIDMLLFTDGRLTSIEKRISDIESQIKSKELFTF